MKKIEENHFKNYNFLENNIKKKPLEKQHKF